MLRIDPVSIGVILFILAVAFWTVNVHPTPPAPIQTDTPPITIVPLDTSTEEPATICQPQRGEAQVPEIRSHGLAYDSIPNECI